MRRLFTFLLLVFCGWTSAVAADGLRQRAKAPSLENTRLCGIMIYDNDKNVETFGHYSYTVTNPIQRKALQLIRAISAEGGAIVKDGLSFLLTYLFFTICAVNVASDTILSPTKTYPFIEEIP